MTATPTHTHHALALLAEASAEHVVLAFPGTEYRLRLAVYQRPGAEFGKRIGGTIRTQARRVDLVRTGGRYVEPLVGPPRRVQGNVVSIDAAENTLVVNAGMPVACKLTDPRQRADQFHVGDLVACEVLPGASFTPAG